MKKTKVLLDFIKFSIPVKIEFYRNVITNLSGNPKFPTPDASLADAKKAVDTLESTHLAAKDGSRTAASAMYAAEDIADDLIRIEANYVSRVADGDETAILSSGFHLTKQPTAAQKADLSIQDGDNSGSVWMVARAVDKAGAYIWQYAKDTLPDTEAGWTTAAHTTQSYYQLTGLTVACKYYCRVAAITPNGTSDYTAAVMKVVN